MIDINYKIREAYSTLLSGVIQYRGAVVPVFSADVPADNIPDFYIYLSNQSNPEGASPKQRTYSTATIQLNLVSRALKNTNTEAVDTMAAAIFAACYPDRGATLQIEGGQIIDVSKTVDNTMSGLTDGPKKVLVRVIVFSHKIFTP